MNLKALTRMEIRSLKKPRRLIIAAVSSIGAFYILPHLISFLQIPDLIWLRIGISGIISLILAETID